jgi:hypothetical protein
MTVAVIRPTFYTALAGVTPNAQEGGGHGGAPPAPTGTYLPGARRGATPPDGIASCAGTTTNGDMDDYWPHRRRRAATRAGGDRRSRARPAAHPSWTGSIRKAGRAAARRRGGEQRDRGRGGQSARSPRRSAPATCAPARPWAATCSTAIRASRHPRRADRTLAPRDRHRRPGLARNRPRDPRPRHCEPERERATGRCAGAATTDGGAQ